MTRDEAEQTHAEINLFVTCAEGFAGHVKVMVPAPSAIKTLRQLAETAKAAGMTPGNAPPSRSGARQPSQPATPVSDTGPACPDHGNAKVGPSRYGGIHCRARNPDGSYCKWSVKAAA